MVRSRSPSADANALAHVRARLMASLAAQSVSKDRTSCRVCMARPLIVRDTVRSPWSLISMVVLDTLHPVALYNLAASCLRDHMKLTYRAAFKSPGIAREVSDRNGYSSRTQRSCEGFKSCAQVVVQACFEQRRHKVNWLHFAGHVWGFPLNCVSAEVAVCRVVESACRTVLAESAAAERSELQGLKKAVAEYFMSLDLPPSSPARRRRVVSRQSSELLAVAA